jgi:hypothetical protein
MKINKFLSIISVAAIAFAAASCNKELTEAEKAQQETLQSTEAVGIYVDGSSKFTADFTGGEVYTQPASLTCRIQSAGGKQYADVVLSKVPVVGETVNVTLKETGVSALSSYNGKRYMNVSVLKLDGNMLYLWSRTGHVGFVLVWY